MLILGGWRLTANVVGKKSYDLLMEVPYAELLVSINGYDWLFVVTDLKESKTHGKNNYSLTAIGHSVYLNEPFSFSRTYFEQNARNIRQLVDYELSGSGWSAIWQVTDWLVPANTWSYANQTPIQVIPEIAKSAGAFVYSHRTNKNLIIKNRYKDVPWRLHLAQPDLALSSNVFTITDREKALGQNWNGCYVAGKSSGGVLGFVKRDGMAGDNLPEDIITHPLITSMDGARSFGSTFIADSLNYWLYKMTMPLSRQLPLVELASLVQVNDSTSWRGITSDLSVSVSLSNREVKVRQSFNLKRWY